MSNLTKITELPRATHEGMLMVGEDRGIPCAVLNDGTRLLSLTGIYQALGRPIRSTIKEGNRVVNMPSFLDANNLQSFVSDDLKEVIKPVPYRPLRGPIKEGYNAKILPLVCDVYLAARQQQALTKKQEPVAIQAEILVRSLSKVGIIALVDEATGYQYSRERDELQKILKAYIAEELLPWQKRFPDIFYKEIFRLNGWDYSVKGIQKRPGVIGTWTTEYIYKQLPPGVLEELKIKTPKGPSNKYSARFHQSLTPEIGEPNLQNQLNSVLTLFQISDNWEHFQSQFQKLVERRKGFVQLELPLNRPPKFQKKPLKQPAHELDFEQKANDPTPKRDSDKDMELAK